MPRIGQIPMPKGDPILSGKAHDTFYGKMIASAIRNSLCLILIQKDSPRYQKTAHESGRAHANSYTNQTDNPC
jgi:hypothetical protein